MNNLEKRIADLETLNQAMAEQLTALKSIVDSHSKHCNANTQSIDSHTKAINTHTVGIASNSFICKIFSARFESDPILQALTVANWQARSTYELFSSLPDDLIERSEDHLKKILGPTLASQIRQ